MNMSTRLLFSGKKCFWKANKVVSIEVLMVQHHPIQIIEIIACDLEMECEAPHLYVDENVLLVKLGLVGDSSQRLDGAKAQYLLDNLILSLYLLEARCFELNIQQNSDELSKTEGLLAIKPLGLCAYVSPFVHTLRSDSVHESVLLSASPPLRCGDSTTEGTESPRRGITETVQWSAEPHLPADIDIARGELTGINSCKIHRPGESTSAPLQHQQQQQKPAGKLPSPKSITDDLKQHQMPHGAPPRPLYPMKSSTSSPNLTNPAGSPRNPRIVSRRVPALPIESHQPPTLVLTEPSICVSTSASAPSSPNNRSAPLVHGSSDCIAAEMKEGDLLAALRTVDKPLSPVPSSDCDTTEISSDHEGFDEEDYYPADLPSQPNSPRKTGATAGMPPLHTRIILGTAEKVGAATWEYHPQQQLARVDMKGHHRRHTFEDAVSIPSALAAAAVGETAADSTTGTSGSGIPLSPRSAKSRLRGMRAALDGLRIPFMHSPRSKVSPSVSSIALEEDLQELEEHPFG